MQYVSYDSVFYQYPRDSSQYDMAVALDLKPMPSHMHPDLFLLDHQNHPPQHPFYPPSYEPAEPPSVYEGSSTQPHPAQYPPNPITVYEVQRTQEL